MTIPPYNMDLCFMLQSKARSMLLIIVQFSTIKLYSNHSKLKKPNQISETTSAVLYHSKI